MRRRPVTRSEIRFDDDHIRTLPADAVREAEPGRLEPIAELFAPLLRSLNRARKRNHEREPLGCPAPYWRDHAPRTCQRCGREFYRVGNGNGRYCSDGCAEGSWRDSRAVNNAALVKARSDRRAAARADRLCAHCGTPLAAQRSSGKFCSVRCRVAEHRARKSAVAAASPTALTNNKQTTAKNKHILAVIGRLKFVFARTMPQTPHEYTVRERAENDADYVALYEEIMANGIVRCYVPHRRPGKYLCPGDGWVYWSMSARRSLNNEGYHPLAVSHHINRCRVEEQERLCGLGVVTPWDPEAWPWGRKQLQMTAAEREEFEKRIVLNTLNDLGRRQERRLRRSGSDHSARKAARG